MPTQRATNMYAPSHSSDDGSNPEIQEPTYTAASSHPGNGTKTNTTSDSSSEPWWRKKSVVKVAEVEPESDEPKQVSYGSAGADVGPSQTQVQQRRWVPPQAPPVVMPEAAAAIRHPKPRSSSSMDEGGDGIGIKVDDVAVKGDDGAVSGEGVGASEAASGINGVEIVGEEVVDAVEASQG